MRCAEVLKGLGVITDPTQATYVFQLADGSIRAVDLPSFSTPTEWKTVYTTQLRYADTGHNYWFRALPDSRAIYFQYRRCAQMADLPFATFQQRLLAALDSERSQRLVIDLRDNGGGNSAIADPLIEELATRVAANRLKIYVLIGRGTFSSAALNAISLKLKAHALFVGEPSGAKPNHFGELKSVQLPNSHLYIFYSTRYWRPWPNDHDASLNPDISVAERWQDLAAGKDAALNASLNDAP
jgi:C-terminal processing protease CtpA/Prc